MLWKRDEDDAVPAAVGGYAFPLVLIVLACAGYLYWNRSKRGAEFPFKLSSLQTTSRVRLSLDNNGPPAESFISNNASTDSLPGLSGQQLAHLPELSDPDFLSRSISPLPSHIPSSRLHPAQTSPSIPPSEPLHAPGLSFGISLANDGDSPKQVAPSTPSKIRQWRGRRSRRLQPVEGDDDSDLGSDGSESGAVFDIGDEEEEPSMGPR